MKEIEVKILEVDRKSLEKRLVSLGAKKIFQKEFNILYFDNGHLKPSKKILRLREEGNSSVLAYKYKQSAGRAKVAQEVEIDVSDFNKTVLILQNIGFNIIGKYRKTRISYEFKGAHVEFDKYHDSLKHIPEFLEIEAKTITKVYECAKLLDIAKEECRPWSINDLIKHYSRKQY